MKKILFTLSAAIIAVTSIAQEPLRFNSNKKFKIVQITDTHYTLDNPKSDVVFELLDEVVNDIKPDLVIFTGDIVTAKPPVIEGWERIIKPLQEGNIPFAATMGNHDDEVDSKRDEIVKFLKGQPYSYVKDGDYEIKIKGSSKDNDFILYLFDSNSYSTNENVDGYGWFSYEQVGNYIAKSKKYSKANGGVPYPALAFFHIPLPEHASAYENNLYPPIGEKNEPVCSPKINTGLFGAMIERGDIMGCFVGHDHVNDYIAYQNNIALVYGRFSGGQTTYGNLRNGCRVIEIEEGVRGFKSYIVERGGKTHSYSAYPRRFKLAMTSDTHFEAPLKSDQYDNVVTLNSLELDGLIINGDLFNRQSHSAIELFKSRYEMGGGDSTFNGNIYIGLGNHDINPISKDSIQNLKERNLTLNYMDSLLGAMREQGLIKSFDPVTRCYSFNLGKLHFIQTNTFAGDKTLGDGSLEWLQEDLKRYGSKGEAIVLLMHYTFYEDNNYWINKEEREALANALKGYNIKAIFNGHDHNPRESKWNGIDVYTSDNVWVDNPKANPSFYMLEYSENGEDLSITKCSY